MKVTEGTFRLDRRKKSFTERAVRQWNTLPSDLVDAYTVTGVTLPVTSSLETFKARLDQALGKLI